jgi:plastocyanin
VSKKLLWVLPILLLSLVLVGCGDTTDQEPGVQPEDDVEGVPPGPVATQEGLDLLPTEEPMEGDVVTGTTDLEGDEVEVLMQNIVYDPPQITVPAGTTVVWTNLDEVIHTVTSGTRENPDGLFDSGDIPAGGTFSYTFDEPGTYQYFCIPHPGMDGTVIVE